MSILKQNGSKVSKVGNNTDTPHDSEAYIAKAVEAHLKNGTGKHNAGAVSILGTYTSIPGTPADLEATIASLDSIIPSVGGYTFIYNTNQLFNLVGSAKTAKFAPLLDAVIPHIDAWGAAPGNLNIARSNHGVTGTLQQCLVFAGDSGGPLFKTDTSEKYNGTAWTLTNNLNTARRNIAGCGTLGCSLSIGGYNGVHNANTEIFNGLTWANTGALITARDLLGAAGTVGAALSFAGENGLEVNVTESFNGTVWSSTTALPITVQRVSGGGNQNAALCVGGQQFPAYIPNSYIFNGSTWLATGNITVARGFMSIGGIVNAARSAGGNNGGNLNTSEFFNGSIWAAGPSSITAAARVGNPGSASAAIVVAGYDTNYMNTAEQYFGSAILGSWKIKSANDSVLIDQELSSYLGKLEFSYAPPISIQIDTNLITPLNDTEQDGLAITGHEFIYTEGTFTATASLNASLGAVGGAGFSDAALCIGGWWSGVYQAAVESFNGSIWTITTSMNTSRWTPGTCGIFNGALAAGGETTGPARLATVEKYNGSLWTLTGSLGTARRASGIVGVTGSAAIFGGQNGVSYYGITEIFNGSTWSAVGSLATARFAVLAAGNSNAAICNGGEITGPGYTALGEKFNGSVWVAGLSYLSGKSAPANGTCGSNSLAASFGGYNGAALIHTEVYNGSLWRSSTPLGVAKYYIGVAGTQATATLFGGNNTVIGFGTAEKWRIGFTSPISPLAYFLSLH